MLARCILNPGAVLTQQCQQIGIADNSAVVMKGSSGIHLDIRGDELASALNVTRAIVRMRDPEQVGDNVQTGTLDENTGGIINGCVRGDRNPPSS